MQLQRPHSLYALIEVAYQNSVSVRLQPATASLYPLNQLLNGSRHRYADFHVEFSELDYFFLLSAGNFSLHQQQHGGNVMFGYRQESHAESQRYLHVIYTVFHKNGDTILMVISLSNLKPYSFSG